MTSPSTQDPIVAPPAKFVVAGVCCSTEEGVLRKHLDGGLGADTYRYNPVTCELQVARPVEHARVLTLVREAGFAVDVTGDGQEALQKLGDFPADVILTDLNMPVVDGYGVIAHRNKSCPQVPLYVMSGDLFPEAREKLCELRVSGCIEKPFSFAQIVEIMEYELNDVSIDTGKSKHPRLQPAAHSMICA